MSAPIKLDTSRAIALEKPHAIPLRPAAAATRLAKPGAAPLAGPAPDPHAQLRHLSHQLEGVFLNQLFQAMRATLPKDENSNGNGEELFTSLMDEKLASVAAERMKRGMGEALYRELSRRLPPEATPERGQP